MEFDKYISTFDDYLKSSLNYDECHEKIIYDAMNYSLLAGGKRIRPLLVLLTNEMWINNSKEALPFSLAIEMIHTYSLIHDDLPCMDNDELRRGKPTCHIAFSEDIALLAGDALLNRAFEVMLLATSNMEIKERGIRAISFVSKCSGTLGMIGGQVIDMIYEKKEADTSLLLDMYTKKTSALISASTAVGAILGGASDREIELVSDFGKYLGLAVQIKDDILDITSDSLTLGKNINSDEKNQKSTFVSLLSICECENLVDSYTKKASECLEPFGDSAKKLLNLADILIQRKK